MLSKKITLMSQSRGWWYDDITKVYSDALLSLGIDLSSDFAQFYLHVEDGVTFHSRNHEIYQICWFVINSSYQLDLKRIREILKIPNEYIPLDGFKARVGIFITKKLERFYISM